MTPATISRNLLSASLFMGLVGCVHLPVADLSHVLPTSTPASQMVVTAHPCWLEEAGRPAHTGLYCRFYFFAGDDPKPVQVRGDLSVVAFEDGQPEGAPPKGQYAVLGKDIKTHLRADVVGDSYVFWFDYATDKPADIRLQATLKCGSDELTSPWIAVHLDPTETPGGGPTQQRLSGQLPPSVTHVHRPQELTAESSSP
jgi:hypothetical protein